MPEILVPLINTPSINWTFNDPTNCFGTVITQMSITSDSSGLKLVGDSLAPGASQFYGTDSGSTKGYHPLSSIGNFVDGTGANTQVAYWISTNTITGHSGFTFDGNNMLAIPRINLGVDMITPCTELSMTTTLSLTAGTSTFAQFLNPNGADRQVNLPASATGLTYFVMNTATVNNITVKDNGGSTLKTIAAGGFNQFVYSGTAWRVI